MPYASLSDFVDAFGTQLSIELTNLEDPTATTVNTAAFERAAADGDGLINSYLAGRYTLPLETVPALIQGIALDIYRYKLGRNAEEKDVRQRYDDALKTLRDIATGMLDLGLPTADSTPRPGSPAYTAPPSVFNRDTLKDYGL